MQRFASVIKLRPEKEREYRVLHAAVWSGVLAQIDKSNIHNYSIFLDPNDGSLFGYVEVEDEARWDAIARTPECRRWWTYMRDIMPTNPDDSPRSVPLREVFHLG